MDLGADVVPEAVRQEVRGHAGFDLLFGRHAYDAGMLEHGGHCAMRFAVQVDEILAGPDAVDQAALGGIHRLDEVAELAVFVQGPGARDVGRVAAPVGAGVEQEAAHRLRPLRRAELVVEHRAVVVERDDAVVWQGVLVFAHGRQVGQVDFEFALAGPEGLGRRQVPQHGELVGALDAVALPGGLAGAHFVEAPHQFGRIEVRAVEQAADRPLVADDGQRPLLPELLVPAIRRSHGLDVQASGQPVARRLGRHVPEIVGLAIPQARLLARPQLEQAVGRKGQRYQGHEGPVRPKRRVLIVEQPVLGPAGVDQQAVVAELGQDFVDFLAPMFDVAGV